MQLSRSHESPTPEQALRRDSAALHEALSNLVRTYQFRDRDRICCYDISVTQCCALETILRDGPMRLNALADRLFLDKSTSSRVFAGLVRKGYAERLTDELDARAIKLSVTTKGRSLYRRILADMIGQQEQIIADLTPAARQAAIEVVTRLARSAQQRFGIGAGNCGPAALCSNART